MTLKLNLFSKDVKNKKKINIPSITNFFVLYADIKMKNLTDR